MSLRCEIPCHDAEGVRIGARRILPHRGSLGKREGKSIGKIILSFKNGYSEKVPCRILPAQYMARYCFA